MTNRATPYGSKFTGWFWDATTPAMKLYNRGTLVETIATAAKTYEGNLVFKGTLKPNSMPPNVTGNTSSYVEAAISLTLDALDTIGLVNDATTT